jgi:ABC-type lipopolysaccharide export system ATPase subunit
MLEVRAVTKRYGGLLAVDNVSFTVNRGEVVGYLSPLSSRHGDCGHDSRAHPCLSTTSTTTAAMARDAAFDVATSRATVRARQRIGMPV